MRLEVEVQKKDGLWRVSVGEFVGLDEEEDIPSEDEELEMGLHRVATSFRCVDIPKRSRGGAAAATWVFRGGESRRRRGCDVDIRVKTGARLRYVGPSAPLIDGARFDEAPRCGLEEDPRLVDLGDAFNIQIQLPRCGRLGAFLGVGVPESIRARLVLANTICEGPRRHERRSVTLGLCVEAPLANTVCVAESGEFELQRRIPPRSGGHNPDPDNAARGRAVFCQAYSLAPRSWSPPVLDSSYPLYPVTEWRGRGHGPPWDVDISPVNRGDAAAGT